MAALEKEERVRAVLRESGGAVVALSGGVDSALVLGLAREELGDRLLAATATGVIYLDTDMEAARTLCRRLGVCHREVPVDPLSDPLFTANTPERCYHCKAVLFRRLRALAAAEGLGAVFDGTNADDIREHRPGRRAAAEAGVVSPLLQAGLSKPEVRDLARSRGLADWDRDSESCLATRIPYGTPVTAGRLEQVRAGEELLRRLGYTAVRLRHHGRLARIEVHPSQTSRLAAPPHRDLILKELQALGFHFVTIDSAGYRSGL